MRLEPARTRCRSMQKGFTMLEAVVALAVFAGGAIALYSLYANNISTLIRAGDVIRQEPVVRQAIERLSAMNLREEGSGEFEVEGMRFTWTARQLGPYRQGQNQTGLIGGFQLGLYAVDFSASERGRTLGQYRMRLVGHQLVRPSFADDDPNP